MSNENIYFALPTILFLISLHFSPELAGCQNVLHREGQPARSCSGALREEPPPRLLQTEAVREGVRGVVVQALVVIVVLGLAAQIPLYLDLFLHHLLSEYCLVNEAEASLLDLFQINQPTVELGSIESC